MDDSDYETTYSEDERISKALREERLLEKQQRELFEKEREKLFQEILEEKELDIFNIPALRIITFRHDKIKFVITPAKIRKYVSSRIKLWVILKYEPRYGKWLFKRDTIPVHFLKTKIINLFYPKDSKKLGVDDESLVHVISLIYQYMELWTEEEETFRLKKYRKLTNGEISIYDIDSADEEIFFNEDEIQHMHEIRATLWAKMLPPKRRRRQKKKH